VSYKNTPGWMIFSLNLSESDMNHSNMYAVGLALCTFANIASEEMARDLCNEIEKLLGSSNTYIRKKVSWWLIIPMPSFLTKTLPGCPMCPARR
jgi:vesicle coat complex subunit